MERTPEPELMEEPEQVLAYADADFAVPHDSFVSLLRERFPALTPRHILDLGCGPGDVTRRIARAYPECRILGIDGAAAMLEAGHERNDRAGLSDRIELRLGFLPGADCDGEAFDAILSNSLLHHLADPNDLWSTIRRIAPRDAMIFVMDLLRPASPNEVSQLVAEYAGDEPEILQRDFGNSLHASYRPDEIQTQLERAGLGHLSIEIVTDRHLIVYGMASAMEA